MEHPWKRLNRRCRDRCQSHAALTPAQTGQKSPLCISSGPTSVELPCRYGELISASISEPVPLYLNGPLSFYHTEFHRHTLPSPTNIKHAFRLSGLYFRPIYTDPKTGFRFHCPFPKAHVHPWLGGLDLEIERPRPPIEDVDVILTVLKIIKNREFQISFRRCRLASFHGHAHHGLRQRLHTYHLRNGIFLGIDHWVYPK